MSYFDSRVNRNLDFSTKNKGTFFRTSIEPKRVHLLVNKLKHPIFGFEQRNIKPNWAITRFTKLLIEQTRTSFCDHQTNIKLLVTLLKIMEPVYGKINISLFDNFLSCVIRFNSLKVFERWCTFHAATLTTSTHTTLHCHSWESYFFYGKTSKRDIDKFDVTK